MSYRGKNRGWSLPCFLRRLGRSRCLILLSVLTCCLHFLTEQLHLTWPTRSWFLFGFFCLCLSSNNKLFLHGQSVSWLLHWAKHSSDIAWFRTQSPLITYLLHSGTNNSLKVMTGRSNWVIWSFSTDCCLFLCLWVKHRPTTLS